MECFVFSCSVLLESEFIHFESTFARQFESTLFEQVVAASLFFLTNVFLLIVGFVLTSLLTSFLVVFIVLFLSSFMYAYWLCSCK